MVFTNPYWVAEGDGSEPTRDCEVCGWPWGVYDDSCRWAHVSPYHDAERWICSNCYDTADCDRCYRTIQKQRASNIDNFVSVGEETICFRCLASHARDLSRSNRKAAASAP